MARRLTEQTIEDLPEQEVDTRPAGQQKKGRPTPKRREAEAARRKPLVVADRKAAKQADREERARQRAIVRQGMLEGDDRYLAPRDRGPVRAYVRDRVDGRFSVGQVMLPVLLTVLVLSLIHISEPTRRS